MLRFVDYVRSGDTVVWGQGAGDPVGLLEALLDQQEELPPHKYFCGLSYGVDTWPGGKLRSYGAHGTAGLAAKHGSLEVVPCHLSELSRMFRGGHVGSDVGLVQVRPGLERGKFTLGPFVGLMGDVAPLARTLIGEINDRIPNVNGPVVIDAERFAATIETSHELIELQASEIGAVEARIGEYVADLVPDGATIETGIGAVPRVVLRALSSHRRLGIHSGILVDEVVNLLECGAVTNEAKEVDRGIVVAADAAGSDRLYEFIRQNPAAFRFSPISYTHSARVMNSFDTFVAINSAFEVDLTGQVNAEITDDKYRGALGGQSDFARAARASDRGCSIIALPATAVDGQRSRIVARTCDGNVTLGRSDVDFVVTEFGVAEVRGRTFEQLGRALAAIAHPDFREGLESSLKTGSPDTSV